MISYGRPTPIDTAKIEYAEAVRLMPDYALAHLRLGGMAVKLGLYEEALKQFEEALRLEPNNQVALELIAQVQNRENRPR